MTILIRGYINESRLLYTSKNAIFINLRTGVEATTS